MHAWPRQPDRRMMLRRTGDVGIPRRLRRSGRASTRSAVRWPADSPGEQSALFGGRSRHASVPELPRSAGRHHTGTTPHQHSAASTAFATMEECGFRHGCAALAFPGRDRPDSPICSFLVVWPVGDHTATGGLPVIAARAVRDVADADVAATKKRQLRPLGARQLVPLISSLRPAGSMVEGDRCRETPIFGPDVGDMDIGNAAEVLDELRACAARVVELAIRLRRIVHRRAKELVEVLGGGRSIHRVRSEVFNHGIHAHQPAEQAYERQHPMVFEFFHRASEAGDLGEDAMLPRCNVCYKCAAPPDPRASRSADMADSSTATPSDGAAGIDAAHRVAALVAQAAVVLRPPPRRRPCGRDRPRGSPATAHPSRAGRALRRAARRRPWG